MYPCTCTCTLRPYVTPSTGPVACDCSVCDITDVHIGIEWPQLLLASCCVQQWEFTARLLRRQKWSSCDFSEDFIHVPVCVCVRWSAVVGACMHAGMGVLQPASSISSPQ